MTFRSIINAMKIYFYFIFFVSYQIMKTVSSLLRSASYDLDSSVLLNHYSFNNQLNCVGSCTNKKHVLSILTGHLDENVA